MNIIKFIVLILAIIFNFNPAYAIVRHHKVDDQKYLELANNFKSIVRIETNSSFGSGILISEDTILTSAHNIKSKQNIKVVIDYTEYTPNTIIVHPSLDLAILKIKSQTITNPILFDTDNQLNKRLTIVGYGNTGTGLRGSTVRDFKKRAGQTTCTEIKKGFSECLFNVENEDLEGCAAPGDSGGGVFLDDKLVGIITYVTGKGGDGKGDSTYGDKTAFISITDNILEWLKENNSL